MQTLEMPGFGIRLASKYLGMNRETLYSWIHSGRVDARLNAVNQYEIPYEELYRLLKERETRR
jgi:predicted site-specific integrase-resolvase